MPLEEPVSDPPSEVRLLTIEKVVDGAYGLARDSDGVVLVPGTLPGEEVEIVPDSKVQGVRVGRATRIRSAHPDRIPPVCPLFLACGGCDFLHVSYERELGLKQDILAETLLRIGQLRPTLLDPVPSPTPEQYRAYIQLKIDPKGRIGLYRRDSHTIVPFDGESFPGCRLQPDDFNGAVARLQGKLAGYKVIKLRKGAQGWVVNLTSDQSPAPAEGLIRQIHDLGATGFLVNDRLVFGSPEVLYIYGEAPGPIYRFTVSPDSFFQADPAAVDRLSRRMADTIDRERGPARLNENLLDLYAGVGTFGIRLASKMMGVFCVESSAGAVRDLEKNMADNRTTNLIAYRSTARAFLKRFRSAVGTVIVDPPRSGLEPDARQALITLKVPLVLYLSCHPATLARDLAALTAGGYKIDSVQLFDQFGRTHHIETLTVLRFDILH